MTTKEYTHLKPYKRPNCYIGATWFGYYDVAGRHRDSDVLTNSNWDCWLAFLNELLGPSNSIMGTEESPVSRSMFGDKESDEIYNWTVCRESHWAVGWIEVIRVHESVGHGKLLKIDEQLKRLDDYPVFDEQHWSDAELNEYNKCWHEYGARNDFIREIRRAFTKDRSADEDYTDEDATLNSLDDIQTERLIELHESLIPSGEYYDTQCWPHTDLSIRAMKWEHLDNLQQKLKEE